MTESWRIKCSLAGLSADASADPSWLPNLSAPRLEHKPNLKHPRSAYCWQGVLATKPECSTGTFLNQNLGIPGQLIVDKESWQPNLSAPLGYVSPEEKAMLVLKINVSPLIGSCWAGATPDAMRSNKTQNLLTDCSHGSLLASCRDRGKFFLYLFWGASVSKRFWLVILPKCSNTYFGCYYSSMVAFWLSGQLPPLPPR